MQPSGGSSRVPSPTSAYSDFVVTSPSEEPQVGVDWNLLAVPERTAIAIAGVSPRRVRYWVSSGLVHASVQREIGRRTVRLYSFRDLIALRVVVALADHHPVQRIRKIVDYARDRLGVNEPLAALRFAVDGDDVLFADEDGRWSGARRPAQLVRHEVLELEPIRTAVRDSVSRVRRREQIGHLERRRGRVVVAGTGVSVATVRAWLAEGATVERIMRAYPTLTEPDIEAVRAQSA